MTILIRLPSILICVASFGIPICLAGQEQLVPSIKKESPAAAKARHRRVANRRSETQIICHRGAVEFAHENTLEAYRATFALGADGNEIDIRATKDGVLVCFHDDMLDHLLDAYGDVSDYSWRELRHFRFRDPGPFAQQCRIPTLIEAFELHRDYAGLMHLDVKRPGLVEPITNLLNRMDMWDHVVQAPADFSDPRIERGRYKASLYLDRTEVDADGIVSALKRPGDSLIVEDPRGVAIALGRPIRRPSAEPVAVDSTTRPHRQDVADNSSLLEMLRDADDWNEVARGELEEAQSAKRIQGRAQAADGLAKLASGSENLFHVLEERVRHRSLHPHWRYNGLDGAASLRALFHLRAPNAIDTARFCLWRNDAAVEAVTNPQWKTPHSWSDWRTKTIVFALVATIPGESSEQLSRDYLALDDEQARAMGPLQFEAAARALLTLRPEKAIVLKLLEHRLSEVRGRAILFCLAHCDEGWAVQALKASAPHALDYVLP